MWWFRKPLTDEEKEMNGIPVLVQKPIWVRLWRYIRYQCFGLLPVPYTQLDDDEDQDMKRDYYCGGVP